MLINEASEVTAFVRTTKEQQVRLIDILKARRQFHREIVENNAVEYVTSYARGEENRSALELALMHLWAAEALREAQEDAEEILQDWLLKADKLLNSARDDSPL